MLNNTLYDRLKFVALIVLPTLATFYLGFGQVWNFPETDKVVTSITLLAAALGAILQISNAKYKADPDGYVTQTGVNPETGLPHTQFSVSKPASELLSKKEVTFKVGTPPPPNVKLTPPGDDEEIVEH